MVCERGRIEEGFGMGGKIETDRKLSLPFIEPEPFSIEVIIVVLLVIRHSRCNGTQFFTLPTVLCFLSKYLQCMYIWCPV